MTHQRWRRIVPTRTRARIVLSRLTTIRAIIGTRARRGPAAFQQAGGKPASSDPGGGSHGAVPGRRAPARVTAAAGCILGALAATGGLGAGPAAAAVAVRGLDVSSHQVSTDWASAASGGTRFACIKATEGLRVSSARFAAQYDGAYAAGLIRGAYHFARPGLSGGAAQAGYFAARGGGWSADGRTLPGALDVEPAPRGARCYGLSPGAMAAWIAGFAGTYRALTSRWPVIYTGRDWWNACTGGYTGFAGRDPLWVARYAAAPGRLPAGWNSYAFWQHTPGGPVTGNQDVFNGSSARLRDLAAGS